MAYVDIPTPDGGVINVYRNGSINPGYQIAAYVRRYDFNIKDAFRFEAIPDSKHDFIKWCGDQACSFSSASNPLADYINAEAGYIRAVFREIAVSHDELKAESGRLEKLISDTAKRYDNAIAAVYGAISDSANTLTNKINTEISGLSNRISEAVNSITSLKQEVQTLTDTLYNFFEGLDTWFEGKLNSMRLTIEGWIVESFIGIIEKVIDREVKR